MKDNVSLYLNKIGIACINIPICVHPVLPLGISGTLTGNVSFVTRTGGVCRILEKKAFVIVHDFHETCHSITSYFIKKTPNDAVTSKCQSQFTPKMKANAVPRLLSSLV